MAGILLYVLTAIAMITFMPMGIAAVDLRHYMNNYVCQGRFGASYHQCSDIDAWTCCRFSSPPYSYRSFSCYNCPRNTIHSVWKRNGNEGTWCDSVVALRSGNNPNCMNLGSVTGSSANAHMWCNACREDPSMAADGSKQLIDTTTGEPAKCTKWTSPDALIIGNRTFNIASMSEAKHEELVAVALALDDGEVGSAIPAEFDTFERK